MFPIGGCKMVLVCLTLRVHFHNCLIIFIPIYLSGTKPNSTHIFALGLFKNCVNSLFVNKVVFCWDGNGNWF